MTPDQLEQIKRREKAATEGPVTWPELGEFVSHAREDIPALVAEVERLRRVLEIIANSCSTEKATAEYAKDFLESDEWPVLIG